MLPSDADLAGLCAGVYGKGSPVAWDHFDAGEDDGVCWALKRLPGYDVIVLRGSVDLQDWLADFNAVPITTRIGTVHAGFFAGMERAWRDIRALLNQPAIITGHSLGAARASILTGLMVQDGISAAARVVFGEPKPGFVDLAILILGIVGRSYRNGDGTHHDLVTDVPFSFPQLDFTRSSPLISVCALPASDDRGPFRFHHIELYQAALAAIPKENAA